MAAANPLIAKLLQGGDWVLLTHREAVAIARVAKTASRGRLRLRCRLRLWSACSTSSLDHVAAQRFSPRAARSARLAGRPRTPG